MRPPGIEPGSPGWQPGIKAISGKSNKF